MDDDCPACHACECHIRETKKIRDAAIEVFRKVPTATMSTSMRERWRISGNAIGISIEELREEE
jgi:hypothetical protein